MSQNKPTVQPFAKRIKNFQEISLGLSKKAMIDEGIRCPQCQDSPCSHACPLGVDIPGFIRLCREGDATAALAKIKEANDLPAICGRICMAPCENSCVFSSQKLSISIRAMERYASDHGRPRFAAKKMITRTGKKVAIIGSGPAGLVAAAQLAKAGLKVTVYEIMPHLGGTLRYGVPEFRLPKNVLDTEIEEIRSLGVEFKTNFAVGQSMKFEQFVGEGYSAVLLTIGKNSIPLSELPGADLGGVYYAKEILLAANTRFEGDYKRNPAPLIGPKVVVLGYNNAAMDCARVCLRLGKDVTLVFPDTIEDLKVYPDDIQYAQDEGLKLEALTKVISIVSKGHLAAGVQCVRMDFAQASDGSQEGGKWELKPAPSSEFVVDAQTIILSGGFKTNIAPLSLSGQLKVNDNHSVWIDPETSLTTIPYLYAAGDAVLGRSTLVDVMASGKKAAQAIIKAVR